MFNDGEGMDKDKLRAIAELMNELVGDMEPSGEDFDMRLGKPKIDVMSMKAESPMEGDEMAMDGDETEDPDDELEQRLMRLKG